MFKTTPSGQITIIWTYLYRGILITYNFLNRLWD